MTTTGDVPPGVLTGLRVVDLSQYLAGPLVAMVLGDLGADVVRIDPPGGPWWDHPANAALQRGKRSIVLDLKDHDDVAIARRLIAQADVVIESFRPGVAGRLGVGHESSLAANPRLVYCSIPGFAAADPRAGVAAWEGVVCAAAGIYVPRSADPDDDIAFNAVPYASSFGAVVTAHSVMAALVARERTGRGQHVEAPLFDALFEAIGHFGMRVIGGPAPRTPAQFAATGGASPQGGFYRCADDRWIHLCLLQHRHLQTFAERFFPPEWLADGMADPARMGGVDTDTALTASDPDLSRRARQRLEQLFRTKPAHEWEHLINDELGCPTAVCLTADEWLADDHARTVDAVLRLDDPHLGPVAQAGHPIRMTATPPRAAGPRHVLDADRADVLEDLRRCEAAVPIPAPTGAALDSPLQGMRVVDCSQVLAGPTAGRILAEYGAEVVKVMSPYDGQIMAHAYTNAGKKSIMVDLKSAEGRGIYLRLARGADVVVENFSLGTTDRMGIGESVIRRDNPDVIYASVSSYGWWEGDRSGWRGREELGQAVTGMELRWGGEGRMPRMQPFALNDYGAGNWAAFAALAGLLHRLRGGPGQHVHTSLAHAATFHQVAHLLDGPGIRIRVPSGQDARGWSAYDRLYRAADRWLYLAAPKGTRSRLLSVLGIGSGLPPDGERTAERIAAVLCTDTAAHWVELLVRAGAGAHAVRSIEEVMDDEQTRARGLSITKDLPGVGPCRVLGPSPRLSGTPVRVTPACSAPGADGRAILERLGLEPQYPRLVAESVLFESLPPGVALVGRVRAAV